MATSTRSPLSFCLVRKYLLRGLTRALAYVSAMIQTDTPMTNDLRLDRLPAVLEQRGDCRTSLYLDIQRGMWTRPVHIGRASVWPHHECQALVRARVAGATEDQLRELVKQLLEQRRAMLPQLGTLVA